MSKRLGELWQTLPEKQKMSWKRKARKAATKGVTMISTGKSAKSGHVGTLPMSGLHQVKGSTSKRAVSHGDGHTIAGQSDQEHKMTAFNVGCQPIDAAAHLKLLGESLSVISARLKEHVFGLKVFYRRHEEVIAEIILQRDVCEGTGCD
ncbi:hypothetical protein NP493_778g04012 [Ridgeia piscesae]|uniref:Uncharacterized protein n=1 Tax=Ridgeia piscesae TaxID=27915 RepID=A0AAD9NLL3_RIDPI|nr:hypothetical protein NP493_778g04012 [Ridgeia piscesae]